MTIDVEDRVRATLRERAAGVEVRAARPEAVFERIRTRQLRRRTTRAVIAVTVVALIGFAAVVRNGSTSVQTGHAAAPAGAPLGQPAFLALAGWHVNALFVLGPYTEYQFTDGARTLQVSFYDLGSREGNKTNPTEVRLRGTTGVTTDEGAPRYRVDWNEQGRTWEADGAPFTSTDDFVSVLEGLTVIDEPAWKASLPAGVGDAILSNAPDANVSWYEDKGISCFDSQNSVPCR